MGRIIFGLLNI